MEFIISPATRKNDLNWVMDCLITPKRTRRPNHPEIWLVELTREERTMINRGQEEG